MAKTDGGSAFPVAWPDSTPTPGMTLRDYFAGQALLGLVGGGGQLDHASRLWQGTCAKRAYEIADAMLEARDAKA